MPARTYTLKTEPVGALYYGLVDSALPFCPLALIVIRPETSLTEEGQRALESLSSFLDYQVKASRWPGTELIGAEADLFYYRLEAKSAQLIKQATNHLYGWRHPDLPEDLCLLRSASEPWLVTIAHEKDGFLVLTDKEYQRLASLFPSLRITLDRAMTQ